jgi:RND family efflux transporter MFP subunit
LPGIAKCAESSPKFAKPSESEMIMRSFASFHVVPVFAVGLSFIGMGCSPTMAEQKNEAPTPVKVSHPVQREITEFSDLTGRTAAVDSVEVRARVFGYLDKFNFQEGMLVKKDDVLFEIDPRNYQATLTQAEGALASAEAKATRLELDLKRAEKLKTQKAISDQEYDKVVNDRAEAVASVVSLKGSVDQARLDVGFTKVTAPISGRVGRALVTQGNFVQSGQSGGGVLTTLISVDPMYVYFDVDERTVLRVRQLIREGKVKSARDVTWPVYVGLGNEDGYPHEGTINFVDNQVNPRSGTLRLRGVFANKDETLSPGYFVRVRVPIGRARPGILISDRAIDSDQGQKIVYIVGQDKKVAVRPIRVGGLYDGLRAVVEGLTTSDRVIVTGIQQIRPGMAVEPTVVDMPKPTPKSEARNPKPSANPSGQITKS